ncbi:MAG: hypothetical protein ACXWQO_04685 [Bdellovibrionota bacterium]
MFLSLLLFSTSAHAVLDWKFVPAPKLQQTKYAEHCGGNFPDLADEMPPNDNQMQSPWCATFSSTAVLDHFYHAANPGDTYQKRLSPVDVNSWNQFGTKNGIGVLPDFRAEVMPNASAILEGVQVSGKVYASEDLPFDQSYFDSNGTLARLSAYYDVQKIFAGRPEITECRDQSPASVGMEKQFTELATILANNATKESFFLDLAKGRLILPVPRAGAARIILKPEYNIRSFVPKSGDELVEEIQRSLHAHRPLATSVCSIAMMQMPPLDEGVLPVPPAEKDKCGPHQMVIIGMEKVDGICQVHLRNSWGQDWGAEGNGNAWLPLKDFLRISFADEPLVTLSERAPGTPVKNEMTFVRGKSTYVGQTWQTAPNGPGILRTPNQTEEGVFDHGSLLEGKVKKTNGDMYAGKFSKGNFLEGIMEVQLQDGSKYKGEAKNGVASGKGSQKGPAGELMSGTFKDGRFMEGTFIGKFTNGAAYSGEFKNGSPSGKGRLVGPDGSVSEGIFSEGKFVTGRFKGLLNAQTGLYYDGKLENGMAVETSKYRDKDGNVWVPKP